MAKVYLTSRFCEIFVSYIEFLLFCDIKGLHFYCRIKSFDFSENGIFFELPKVLTLTDCVIRAMFTKFDHLSVHCSSYLPQVKLKIIDG